MSGLIRKLWSDDNGAMLATEFLFMTSLLTIGTVSGLVAVRQSILSELVETGNAIMRLDESYSFSGQSFAVPRRPARRRPTAPAPSPSAPVPPALAMINQACD